MVGVRSRDLRPRIQQNNVTGIGGSSHKLCNCSSFSPIVLDFASERDGGRGWGEQQVVNFAWVDYFRSHWGREERGSFKKRCIAKVSQSWGKLLHYWPNVALGDSKRARKGLIFATLLMLFHHKWQIQSTPESSSHTAKRTYSTRLMTTEMSGATLSVVSTLPPAGSPLLLPHV